MYPPSYPPNPSQPFQPTQPALPTPPVQPGYTQAPSQPIATPTPSGAYPSQPSYSPDAPTVPGAAGDAGGYPAPWAQSPYAQAPGQAPVVPPPTSPPAPGATASLRLTMLAVAMLIIITIIAFTAPVAVASARTIAYPRPVVSIGVASGAAIHIGDTVSFTATVGSGHDLSYNWDFGDNTTAVGEHVEHVFQQNGPTTVTLTATDPIGQSAQASQNLNILFGAPTATFTYQADLTNYQCGVDFDASSSTGQNLSYAWDFGNGDTSQESAPSEGYAQAGTYQVTLTVTDTDNQTATDTQSVVVTCAPPPTASFVYTPDSFYTCGIDFDATASTGSGLSNYVWDFGDGNAGSGETTTWDYSQGGSYNVTLTVTDQYGQTGSTSQTVNVNC
ncbi:MAG TPA: PKD domain-containing protein [Ktedonobacterales bacterium]|nr:PKD domain-containing protein [Ktedonobacterales bacterium]